MKDRETSWQYRFWWKIYQTPHVLKTVDSDYKEIYQSKYRLQCIRQKQCIVHQNKLGECCILLHDSESAYSYSWTQWFMYPGIIATSSTPHPPHSDNLVLFFSDVKNNVLRVLTENKFHDDNDDDDNYGNFDDDYDKNY